MVSETAQTPDEQEDVAQVGPAARPGIDLNDPSVNRRRERRIYYRQHFDREGNSLGWFPTLPLPSDPWHQTYYIKKGFKLWPPGNEPGQKEYDKVNAQVKELEDKAEAMKAATAESEAQKAELEAEVKRLQEQADTLRTAMPGEIKAQGNVITCPVDGCNKTVSSYKGLARHMQSMHGLS